MQSQGAGFTEAVEQLAAEAGMEVPKPSPEAAEAEQQAARPGRGAGRGAQRATSAGCACRRAARRCDYLRGRGLTDETIRRFGLGWSGEGRGALAAELKREGIEPDLLVEAGLLRGGTMMRRAGGSSICSSTG